METRLANIIFELCFCCLILTTGCGGGEEKYTEEEMAKMPLAPRDDLPACTGGLVLKVNNEALTTNEIIKPAGKALERLAKTTSQEEFEMRARPHLERYVWNKISDLILYQQAKRSLPDGADTALDKAVNQEVDKFIVSFGGDYARAEKALKEGGLDWKRYRERQKRFIITQIFISEQLSDDKPITHRELLEHYDLIKSELYSTAGEIEFRLIDIQPGKVISSDTTYKEPAELRKEAEELAEQLVEHLKGGGDFGQLAKEYSHGHRASEGGLWKPVQWDSLAQPYDVLEKEAEKMKVGQIAGPIEAKGHFFIMKLEKKQQRGFRPFEEVQREVEIRLINKRRQEALEKLLDKYIRQAEIGDTDKFIELCLQEIYRKYSG
jgi:parvulin-like peptidyl-prolyl isomerase